MKCIYCKVELIKTPLDWIECPECSRNYNEEGRWFFAGKHFNKKAANIYLFFLYLKTNDPEYIPDIIKYYRRLHPEIPENLALKCFLKEEKQAKITDVRRVKNSKC